MEYSLHAFTPPVVLHPKSTVKGTFCHSTPHTSTCSPSNTVTRACVTLHNPTSSRFFQALPDGLPPEKRPQPPPQHWRIPIIGFLVDHYTGKSREVLANKYGPIYKSSFVSGPMTFITDMPAINDILRAPELFTTKGASKIIAKIFGDDSMLLLEGREHAAVRKKVSPAFATAVFPFLFDKIAARASKTWASLEKSIIEKGKQKADPAMRRNYLSLIVEITTGIDMDSDMAPYLLDRFFTLSKSFFTPPVGPFAHRGTVARAEILTVIEDRIKMYLIENKQTIDKLREYAENLTYKGAKDIKKGDVNVMLIAIASSDLNPGPGAENDPKEIASLADLMLLLWFAGFATSAATTSCAVFEMGMDRSIWDQLHAEQDALMRDAGDTEVTYEQVASEMPLLDSFITEMLRLHPASQGGFRMLTRDARLLGTYARRGERVFLDFFAAMRDPRVYPDPDVLQVDRFVRADGRPPPPAVLAFGAPGSPHYCLGAALAKIMMRTTLAVLLREYELVLDPRQSRKYAIVPDMTPRSKVVVQSITKRK